MKLKLSESLGGFHKGHITQHALLKTIGTWDYLLNIGNKVGASAMDFSKAIDTLNQNLLCKLIAYGFDSNALTLIRSYFSNRNQLIKAGDKLRKWQKI